MPACVEETLEAYGLAFEVISEAAGPIVEVIGNTRIGGEMIHAFDFRSGRDITSPRDWSDEAQKVLDDFDAFDVAVSNRGHSGAPEGEDLYEDVKSYKDSVLKPLAEVLADL